MSEAAIRAIIADAREITTDDVIEDGCPVAALGQRDGRYFFLARSGELRVLAARDLMRNGILSLFDGHTGWLAAQYPKYDREGKATGEINYASAAAGLMRLAATHGLYDADTPVRGAGVWRGIAGTLIAHCGSRLFLSRDGTSLPAGRLIGDAIYPASTPLQPPSFETGAAGRQIARRIMDALELWAYRDGYAARLLFGWLVVAMLGAAPSWRVHVLVTGQRGCGKSKLTEFVKAALGAQARLANNFTEAGLRQMLTGEARAVMLDEAEGAGTSNRVEPVIELLRQMSGGDGVTGLRGSIGGAAQRFSVTGSAWLSAINAPQLQPQDRSRITEIELRPPNTERAGQVDDAIAFAAEASTKLRGRAIEGWPRFGENLLIFRAALLDRGCDGRQADQLGAMLAGAEMMLHDDPVFSDVAREQVASIAGMIANLIVEDEEDSDARQCLSTLLTSPVDHWRGGARSTIGAMVAQAMNPAETELRRALRVHGVRLELDAAAAAWMSALDLAPPFLLIANRHQMLEGIFRDTRWPDGGWRRSLQRLSGALAAPEAVNFDGAKSRCIIVPREHLPEGDRS